MEQEVLKSWSENADEWIKALDEKKIPSREVTNKAIVAAITELGVNKLLDCGCGEGWLARRMTKIGKKCVGVDATSKLIKSAQSKGPEAFYSMSYDHISDGVKIPESPFEAAVFNFCLYQKDGLSKLFKSIKKAILNNGFIIIQTLHPYFLKQEGLPLKSQWITNSWKGVSGDFKNGHRWYARIFEDWLTVFSKSDVHLKERIEVKDSKNIPVSVIFVLSLEV